MDELPAYGLAQTASNQEILTARAGVETVLAALGRVCMDETKLTAVYDKLAELPILEIHRNSFLKPELQGTVEAYKYLANMRQQEIGDPKGNPSLPNPNQSAELYKAVRNQNIDFINHKLQFPEINQTCWRLNQQADLAETGSDLSDQQIEELATQALIDRLALGQRAA